MARHTKCQHMTQYLVDMNFRYTASVACSAALPSPPHTLLYFDIGEFSVSHSCRLPIYGQTCFMSRNICKSATLENQSSIPRIPTPWESSLKDKSLTLTLWHALVLCGRVSVWLFLWVGLLVGQLKAASVNNVNSLDTNR